jgi:hypothetical protein
MTPFEINRMKKFFGTMLRLAIILTLVITILLFISHIASGGSPVAYLGSPNFIMGITFLILEYVGHMMLHGKFQPPTNIQQKRPQPPQKVPMKQITVPLKIETDNCCFCGKEKLITEMRPFYDGFGNEILVCEDCIKKERK